MNDHAQPRLSSPRLEIIHLRPVGPTPPGLLDEISKSIQHVVRHRTGDVRWGAPPSTLSPSDRDESKRRQQQPVTVRFFNRGPISTDLAIHIRIAPGTREPDVLELGARLAAELKPYGMVTHAIWQEVKVPEGAVK
jgi:hypothetical protein